MELRNSVKQSTYSYFLSDDEAPDLYCPDRELETDEGVSTASNYAIQPTVQDNADGSPDLVCSHSFDTFEFGDTVVACNASDSAGNVATCDFVVTVRGTYSFHFRYVETGKRRSDRTCFNEYMMNYKNHQDNYVKSNKQCQCVHGNGRPSGLITEMNLFRCFYCLQCFHVKTEGK